MTTADYIRWRVQVYEFRLAMRLKSPHEAIAESARLCQHEANILRSLLDTPHAAMTLTQQIWYAWIKRAAALYEAHGKEDGYRAMAAANREDRDYELAQLKEAA